MSTTNKWSFHDYLGNSREGLLARLELSKEQRTFLEDLRNKARVRIKEVFKEVQEVFSSLERLSPNELTQALLRQNIEQKKNFHHVDENLLDTLVKLASNLNDEQRKAFLKIRPKFRPQGSFQYKTLNLPYRKPPQEMDIDDGVYFPMQMFEDAPALAHRLMIAIVDSALQSLAAENKGWNFDSSKATCARIRVSAESAHLDVAMYAIPEEKFIQINEFLDAKYGMEALSARNEFWLSEKALLDPSSVLLARRDRDKWQKSDPQVVQQWFTESVDAVGEHLRLACRFLKAWRDVTWGNGGGPSSITLMKCAVDTLGQSPLDGQDLGLVMLAIAASLPTQLHAGVTSPDDSDEKPLFPNNSEHNDEQKAIVEAAVNFEASLHTALTAATKNDAHRVLCSIFGERGINNALIISLLAAPAYAEPAKKSEPAKIEQTMTSG